MSHSIVIQFPYIMNAEVLERSSTNHVGNSYPKSHSLVEGPILTGSKLSSDGHGARLDDRTILDHLLRLQSGEIGGIGRGSTLSIVGDQVLVEFPRSRSWAPDNSSDGERAEDIHHTSSGTRFNWDLRP